MRNNCLVEVFLFGSDDIKELEWICILLDFFFLLVEVNYNNEEYLIFDLKIGYISIIYEVIWYCNGKNLIVKIFICFVIVIN